MIGKPFQDDEDGAATQQDFIELICKRIISNGQNGCGFVRIIDTEKKRDGKIVLDHTNIEYVTGVYESEEISINDGGESDPLVDLTQLSLELKAFFNETTTTTINQFVLHVGRDGNIYKCYVQEDYSEFSSILESASNHDFLDKFKIDYLRCKENEPSRFINLSPELFTAEQEDESIELFGGNQIIKDDETGFLHHSLKCNIVLTSHNSTPEQMQQAADYVSPTDDLKIWVHKGIESFELKSEIPQYITDNLVVRDNLGNLFFEYSLDDFFGLMVDAGLTIDQALGNIYEFYDLCSKGVRKIRIPEKVWNCNDDDYNKFYKYAYKFITFPLSPVKDALIYVGGNAIANEVQIDSPELASVLRNLSDGSVEFAFICGVYNGLVETIATIPDLGKITHGLLCSQGRDDFTQMINKLKQFEKEDGSGNTVCSGVWCAMRVGLADNFDGECKISEFGGEIAFVVLLSLVDPAAVEAFAGKALANIIKVLQYIDDFTGKVANYALKFTSKGVGYVRNSAQKAFARFVDGQIVAKAINTAGDVVDIPKKTMKDIKWSTNAEGKLVAQIDDQTYELLEETGEIAIKHASLLAKIDQLPKLKEWIEGGISTELLNKLDDLDLSRLTVLEGDLGNTTFANTFIDAATITPRLVSAWDFLDNSPVIRKAITNLENLDKLLETGLYDKAGITLSQLKAKINGSASKEKLIKSLSESDDVGKFKDNYRCDGRPADHSLTKKVDEMDNATLSGDNVAVPEYDAELQRIFNERSRIDLTQAEKVRYSENLALARADVIYRGKGWNRLDVDDVPQGKQGKFDRIYENPETGEIHVVECKGGVGEPHFGSRETAVDGIAQQGTEQYRDDIINRLIADLPIHGGDELATKLEDAFGLRKVNYTLVNQRTGSLSSYYFKQFP